MANLLHSQWAPRCGRHVSAAPEGELAKPYELHKYDRLYRRLLWKSSILLVSHERATGTQIAPLGPEDSRAMFKVDFFEYYLLLERFLVEILNIFRVPIKRSTPDSMARPGAHEATSSVVGASARPLRYHRFHEDILQCLDRPSNPLHFVLGVAPVRSHLQIAKDFRNQCKDAAESYPLTESDLARGMERKKLSHNRAIDELDLSKMISSITDALRSVRDLIENKDDEFWLHESTDGKSTSDGISVSDLCYGRMDYMDEETPWEAIPDLMDWEQN